VIEVNYRPSLARGTSAKGKLKKQMLIDAFHIVLDERISPVGNPRFAESARRWPNFLRSHPRTWSGYGKA
jgi:hypothetical protein